MAVSRENEATDAWPWLTYALGACAVVFFYTLPIVTSGLIGSDIVRAALPAYAAVHGLSIWQTLSVVGGNTAYLERLPIRSLELAFWFLHPAAQLGHELQVVLLALNVATASLIAAILLRNAASFGITAACAVACLQFRPGDDPTLGQTLTSTVGCEFALLAILASLIYFDTRKPVWFLSAVVIGVLTAFADASSLALAVAVPAIIVFRPQARFAGAIALAAAMALPIGLLSVLQGISLASQPESVASRLAAALPTSYRLTHALVSGRPSFGGGPPDLRFSTVPGIGPSGLIAALGSFMLFYIGSRRGNSRTIAQDRLALLACGVALWMVPAWLAGGAYVQWLGVAMIASALLSALLVYRSEQRFNAVFAATAALIVAIVVLGNAATERVILDRNQRVYATRQLFEQSAAAGLFNFLSDRSTIALDPRSYPFVFSDDWRDARYTIYAISGKLFNIVPATRNPRILGRANWLLTTSSAPDRSERELDAAHWVSAGPDPLVDRLISFRSFANPAARDAAQAAILGGGRGLVTSANAVGDAGLLAFVTRGCGASTIADAFNGTPRIIWGAGFLPDESYPPAEIIGALAIPFSKHGAHPWRFASQSSVLEVVRDNCRQTPILLTMTISAAAPGVIAISTQGYRSIYTTSQLPTTIRFAIPPGRPGSVARVRIISETPAARLSSYSIPRARYLEETGDVSLFVEDPKADYN